MRKKLAKSLGIFAILLCTMLSLPIHAQEAEIPEQHGSITISLNDTEDSLPKKDVVFSLTKVADIIDGRYETIEEFESLNIDFNELKTAEQMQDAAEKLKDASTKEDQTTITDETGTAVFTDIPIGVYLVHAKDIAEYERIMPGLIAIPTWNEEAKDMTFDITMFPKHSHLPVIRVNKIDSITRKNIKNKQFEFSSFKDSECKEKIETKQANTIDGTAEFTTTYGTIYIKETAAPQGYKLSNEVVKVEFNDDGMFVNDEKIDPVDGYIYSIVYQNAMLPSIQTGIQNYLIPYLMLLVGAGLVLGILVMNHKKKNKNQKEKKEQ